MMLFVYPLWVLLALTQQKFHSLVVSETMFSCLEYKISLTAKQHRRFKSYSLRFGMIAVSTDQPWISNMQFVVAAFCGV